MAAASFETRTQFFVVGASTAYTLREYATAIVYAALWNGTTTQTGFTTATITTATSTVVNSLAFTGTDGAPSNQVTTGSGTTAASMLFVEYIPAGAVESHV